MDGAGSDGGGREMTKESTDLVAIQILTPDIVFVPGGVDAILGKIENEVRSIKTDISTPSGRAAIASLAYKVARSKTALDEMGKTLVSDLKAKSNAIDAERRTIRERLDALKDEARQPLTEWETAEKNRVAAHEAALLAISDLATSFVGEQPPDVYHTRIRMVDDTANREWQEFSKRASEAVDNAKKHLAALLSDAEKRDAERAELERLQREQVEREQRERDERIAREAADKARMEAEAKARSEAEEAERKAREERELIERTAQEQARKAEADRIAAEAKAKAAAEAAERKASEERAKIQREKSIAEQAARDADTRAKRAEAERVAVEAKAKNDAEQAERLAEKRRQEAIEAERRSVADAKAAADVATAKREADKKHRAKVNGEAREAMIANGLTPEQATLAITVIARGAVPRVSISY